MCIFQTRSLYYVYISKQISSISTDLTLSKANHYKQDLFTNTNKYNNIFFFQNHGRIKP